MEKWSKKFNHKHIVGHDFKLVAHNAVRLHKWVVLEKLNPNYCVKADGTLYPLRDKKIVETFRGI